MSENYESCDVYGLIITARCDVANGKAPIFSYIPVLPYKEWVMKDGAEIIASRISANSAGEMKKIIKSAGLAEEILETISISSISQHLEKDSSKDGKSRAKRFHENVVKKTAADEHLSTGNLESAHKLVKENTGLYHGLVKELVGNIVADFHYLDQIEFGKESAGYVALLREIRFMPSRIAARILDGLDRNDYALLEKTGTGGMRFRSDDDYAMPVGLLKSPFIEFLMQRLTNLFGRIGVTDIAAQRVESLKNVFSEIEERSK
jgi:hypothetical protein